MKISKEELFDTLVVSVEHDHLCFRTSGQWLLHSVKLEDMPDMGLPLAGLETVLMANYETMSESIALEGR